jgi:hypothetical protein
MHGAGYAIVEPKILEEEELLVKNPGKQDPALSSKVLQPPLGLLRFQLGNKLDSFPLTMLKGLAASLQTEAETVPELLASIGSKLDNETVSDTLGHQCT